MEVYKIPTKEEIKSSIKEHREKNNYVDFKIVPLTFYQWLKKHTQDKDIIESLHLANGNIVLHARRSNMIYILDGNGDERK